MVATETVPAAQQQEEPQQQQQQEGAAPPTKQQQQDQQDPEARYRYDEALLIRRGKGKEAVPPTKPNVEEKRLVITKLLEEITRRNNRIQAIKRTQEDARSNSRASTQATTNPAIQRLQALKQQFNTVLRHKQHLSGEHRAVCQERDALREQLRQMKERLPKRTAKDGGEAELRDLEFELQTSSLSAVEEKAKQARLKELANARPMLREVQAAEERFTERTGAREALMQQMQALSTQLDALNAQLEGEKATVEAARASSNNQEEQGRLNAEKQECWECIQVLRAKINEIDHEFSQKYQEWIKLDKNYNNYVRFVERQKFFERQAKRQEIAQRRAEEEEMAAARANGSAVDASSSSAAAPSGREDADAPPPYAGELLKLDQLLTCLRKVLPAEDKGGAQHGEKKAVEVPQGMKPLKKKDEEEEFMSVPKKKPQGKKGAPAAEAPAPAPKSNEPAKKKLNHQLETLQTFMQYGIEVPQWSTEVANTIQKVEAKKQEFVTKGQQEKEAKANGTFRAPIKAGKNAAGAEASPSSSKAKEGAEAEASANGVSNGEQQQQQQGEQQQQDEQPEQQQQAEEPPAANGNHTGEANGDVSKPSEPSKKKAARKGDGVGVTLHVDSASERVAVQLAA